MITLDFETAYTDTYSLSKMGAWAYCFHSDFECYQVAVVKDDNVIFNGHPRNFDWELLRGELLAAHNAGFDALVFKRLQQDGVIPKDLDNEWICTADLAVYFQAPRDLKGAALQLIGMTISKAYRAKAKGKTGAQIASSTDNAEIVEAGADDAVAADRIAHKYLPLWPDNERLLSKMNRETGWRGVMVDVEKNKAAMQALALERTKLLRLMVWADNADDAPLSMTKIREHGRKTGVPVPASLDAKSADAQKWYLEYGESHPWVLAVRDYRRLNTFYKKLEVLDREHDDAGIYRISKKYFGAGTGRFSGGGKFNAENLPRDTMFGVDMRSHLIARPGHILCSADYAQIEARLLLWRAGDAEFINIINEVGNIYVAYDIKTGRYPHGTKKKDVSKPDYQAAKIKVLGLGYGMGHRKFRETALLVSNLVLSAEEAAAAVTEYREANQKVVELWRWHDAWLRASANAKDPTHEILLRSGRRLVYHEPRAKVEQREDGSARVAYVVKPVRGDHDVYTYGGKLVENEIQATARDVLRDAWIGLEKAGYNVITTIHDEFLLEIPEDKANEDTKREVRHIMLNSSPWAEGAPLDVDLEDMKYTKCFCK